VLNNSSSDKFNTIYIFYIINRKKYNISPCGRSKLQIVLCGIKVNSKVSELCQKYNLVLESNSIKKVNKFR
jgi:hypothetical protein